ncbi:MAG: Gfo/Idh/MocA family protein [Chthonomonadales bacterium]
MRSEEHNVQSDLKVGIIGCGALGAIHAKRMAAIPGVRVCALADPNEGAAASLASQISPPPLLVSTDHRRILEAGLHAVCIASPDGCHVSQLLDALAAGLHVLCEKPLTLEPKELEACIAARDRAGTHVAMTYPRRYHPSIREMRRQIQSGRWGSVYAVSVYNCEDWVTGVSGTWRHDPAMCPGGFIYDANGHQIDTLLWMTGLRARWVHARVDNRGAAVPLTAQGTAELSNGTLATFCFVGTARRWREQINIHCEGMDFVLENGRCFWSPDAAQGQWAPLEALPVPDGDDTPSYRVGEADNAFARLLRGEGPNWAPLEEVWPVLLFTRALLKSGETGKPVQASHP